ncbi:cell surface glycoprotein CD200 receptor 1 [Trichechus manatus latirostris]|uniref:Cell surface glycoprotein CD200 receptor 1 n=1 Tax=Trichechus manatus latirostris TaxID=127582 RepID=A0A2Y9FY47_TRIMA|nr:cell surface glycoprotein CD200 receptor 1 [Trichechus manatus latirostris]
MSRYFAVCTNGHKTVLFCPLLLLTTVVLTTWEIVFRDKPSCIKAYRSDENETMERNCIAKRITWTPRPEQNPALQINPVARTHDGYRMCTLAMPDGNFQHHYHLFVLMSPGVTLLSGKNRTAVCKAFAGKPAAQISWAPDGDCITEHEPQADRAVTVKSTCCWTGNNVSNVTYSVVTFVWDQKSLHR